jgi:hypothetical protein
MLPAYSKGIGRERRRIGMKIYMLVMLIGVILGLSHLPLRLRAKQNSAASPDSLPA